MAAVTACGESIDGRRSFRCLVGAWRLARMVLACRWLQQHPKFITSRLSSRVAPYSASGQHPPPAPKHNQPVHVTDHLFLFFSPLQSRLVLLTAVLHHLLPARLHGQLAEQIEPLVAAGSAGRRGLSEGGAGCDALCDDGDCVEGGRGRYHYEETEEHSMSLTSHCCSTKVVGR